MESVAITCSLRVAAALQAEDRETAWSAADRARARRFIDLVRQEDFDISNLNEAQQARYSELRRTIAVRADKRTEFLSSGETRDAELITRDLVPLIDELDLLQDLARSSELTSTEAASLAELQAHLGDNQVLLEFFIGKTVAGVWQIRRDYIDFHPIANAGSLEKDVRDAVAKGLHSRKENGCQV